MAVIRRYPLNSIAMKEFEDDLTKLWEAMGDTPESFCEYIVDISEKAFHSWLGDATSGRQAVISTSTSYQKHGKYGATGTLTATGKTEDTGFNILMAVEFGAGIAGVNGFANTSFELGMGSGTWPGQTHAYDFEGWWYPSGEFNENGDEIYRHTYGTPATMPMHNTIQGVKQAAPRILREVMHKWLT